MKVWSMETIALPMLHLSSHHTIISQEMLWALSSWITGTLVDQRKKAEKEHLATLDKQRATFAEEKEKAIKKEVCDSESPHQSTLLKSLPVPCVRRVASDICSLHHRPDDYSLLAVCILRSFST